MHLAILSDPANFHTQKWARSLSEAGARVTIFSFDAGTVPGIECIQLKPPFRQKGSYGYTSYSLGGRVLRQALEAKQVDIVNALNITPFGVWALKANKRPLIASALGADILEYPPKLELSPILATRSWDNIEGNAPQGYGWKRRFHRRQVAKVLAAADLVTGDNQTLLHHMRDWFGVTEDRMRLLRWGVEPELFQLSPEKRSQLRKQFGIQPGQPVVLSPRGAKAIYQGDLIIEAFERLLSANTVDCRFIMLGAGYQVAKRVAEKAAQLEKQHPNFLFVPEQLPRETIYGLWNEVDLFISAPVYDGYSAALAEGRYAGAIPVVNDIPATRELIQHGENGWVVDPFTPTTLAVAVEELLGNLSYWKAKMAPANRKWIENHSLQSTAAHDFMDLCEGLLAQNRS